MVCLINVAYIHRISDQSVPIELAGWSWRISDCVWQSTCWYKTKQRRQTCASLLCGLSGEYWMWMWHTCVGCNRQMMMWCRSMLVWYSSHLTQYWAALHSRTGHARAHNTRNHAQMCTVWLNLMTGKPQHGPSFVACVCMLGTTSHASVCIFKTWCEFTAHPNVFCN